MGETLEEIRQKREKRQKEQATAELEQETKDEQALYDLEGEHPALATVKTSRFIPGHPRRAFVRMPSDAEYKRYRDNVGKAAKKNGLTRHAQDELAKACWVYPLERVERDRMAEAFPGILTSIAVAAAGLAEGNEEEEGKG